MISAINLECGIASFDKPEMVIGEWRMFFRGWMESQAVLDIRGFMLACAPSSSVTYYCEAGTESVQALYRGAFVKVSVGPFFTPETPRKELVEAVNVAREAMRKFIAAKSE